MNTQPELQTINPRKNKRIFIVAIFPILVLRFDNCCRLWSFLRSLDISLFSFVVSTNTAYTYPQWRNQVRNLEVSCLETMRDLLGFLTVRRLASTLQTNQPKSTVRLFWTRTRHSPKRARNMPPFEPNCQNRRIPLLAWGAVPTQRFATPRSSVV